MIANRYEIVRPLGAGSFGRTFLAHDREADRPVAMKVLDRRSASDWKAFELFEREASVLRSLRHHGVPEMYDLIHDEWEGAPAAFLVMELVEGIPLSRHLDEARAYEPAEVMHLFVELLGVLDYLHTRVPPILHRDIKPANVILRPDGTPVLVDFGSVRRQFLGPEESGSTIVGTYGYMPYEQYMGQASAASDLFALGATMLHLVTGRAPREFLNDEGRLEVPSVLPGDPRLAAVIAKLLRPSPAERYASAREVRDALLTSVAVQLRARAVTRPLAGIELLGPAPRALAGDVKGLVDRAAPSIWQLLHATSRGDASADAGSVASLVFFSILTAGMLPVVYIGMARRWRKRLRRFFREGTPAMAEVVGIELERIPFDETLARVTYQFEADGQLHRDSDQVLPSVSRRWQAGDRIQILYIAGRDYDSAIVCQVPGR